MTDTNQKFKSSSYTNKIKVEFSTTRYTNLVIDKEPVFEKVHDSDRVVAAAAAVPDTPRHSYSVSNILYRLVCQGLYISGYVKSP